MKYTLFIGPDCILFSGYKGSKNSKLTKLSDDIHKVSGLLYIVSNCNFAGDNPYITKQYMRLRDG